MAKWRKRTRVADLPNDPRSPSSTGLGAEDEAMIVAFRRHTLLPLDDGVYELQPTIPQLTRASLHRCLQRHGASRLAVVSGDGPAKTRVKRHPLGYFHIDVAEVRTAEGKLNLFVSIDRTSKFAARRLERRAGEMQASQVLRDLLQADFYRIHTILADTAFPFANRAQDTFAFAHIFGRDGREHEIEHRLAKGKHPWANGQVERVNRTIKYAAVKRSATTIAPSVNGIWRTPSTLATTRGV